MQAKFDQLEMVLFDSTIAQFKLSIKGSFTRSRQDNSIANLVYMNTYTTRQGKVVNTLKMNPNIYVIYEYRGETYDLSKQLYTSFPQLFPITEAMRTLKDFINTGVAFNEVEGILQVDAKYQDPIIISGIGKDDKWISFSVAAVDESDNQGNITRKVPGVAIQISDAEYASVLTAEEFLTVFTIIDNIDLAGIQTQLASLFYLSSELGSSNSAPAYQAPAKQNYQARQSQYSNQNQSQQQNYQSNNTQAQGGAPYQAPQNVKPSYNQAAPTRKAYNPRPAPVVRAQPQTEVTPQQFMENTQSQAPVANTQRGNLPPRKTEKNIVNMKNVAETKVSSIDFNDPAQVNKIFEDEE